uniref:Uncharacterized protein n=1 Tax=viral metagenome TaxID=1070528 RepID=A0A6M3J7N1_9ZZZZ
MRKVKCEIRKTEEGKFWGLVVDKEKENNSRFITEEYDKYKGVITEARIRSIQLGWDCVVVEEVVNKEKI